MRSLSPLVSLCLALAMAACASATDTTTSCKRTPFHVSHQMYWPAGQNASWYNSLHIVRVYVVPGRTDARWCAFAIKGSCGPEPTWFRKTAGWLYETRIATNPREPASYLFAPNGYELDGQLSVVDVPLANVTIMHAIRCE